MALPKQVEQQMREVEELERQMAAPVATEETPPTETPPADVPVAEVVPPQEPVVPVAPVVSEETWEHKYQTLIGKFNAEVPRLHQQNKELTNQLQGMQTQIDTLKQPAAAPATAASSPSCSRQTTRSP